MKNKTLLTERQEIAMTFALKVFKGDKDRLIAAHKNLRKPWERHMKPLNDLSVSDLSKALYLGYEIKTTHKT